MRRDIKHDNEKMQSGRRTGIQLQLFDIEEYKIKNNQYSNSVLAMHWLNNNEHDRQP